MIIVIDGLDSVEQKKVLKVLDLVHTLFSGGDIQGGFYAINFADF